MTPRRVLFAVGLSLVLAGACSQDELFSPAVPLYKGGAMFQRYVSMGNSVTAGFQSGGINDSTQKQSYAAKLAAAMGGDRFNRPSLTIPGCPPPIDTLFTASGVPRRRGGTAAPPCSLRSAPLPPYVSNVAVPGATVFDPFHAGPTPSANALTLLILGARSQIQAMRAAKQQGSTMPPEATAQIAQMKQQLDQAHQVMQQAQNELKLKGEQHQREQETKLKLAQMAHDQAIEIQKMKDASALAVARLTSAANVLDQTHEDAEEAIALAQQQQHEAEQNALDREHELDKAQMGHEHALEQGQQSPPLDPNRPPLQAGAGA